MQYTSRLEINAPFDKVVKLWQDETQYHKWQTGFVSKELISGSKGGVGAKSKIIFEDKMKIELIETILENNLPHSFKGLYEHEKMDNTNTTKFEDLGDKTVMISEIDYLEFKGIMMKIIGLLFKSKFREQSEKWMEQFKLLAEKQ
jgi:uncharacterized membrane protein